MLEICLLMKMTISGVVICHFHDTDAFISLLNAKNFSEAPGNRLSDTKNSALVMLACVQHETMQHLTDRAVSW